RASEGFNVSQSSTISLRRTDAKRGSRCLVRVAAQTYPRRRTALATYRPTRWISRFQALGLVRQAPRSLHRFLIAQRFAFELDLVAAVHDTVQDRVGEGWVVQVGVPCSYRQLAGDQRRARAHAVVQHLQQIV